jgi:hypothetical protein
VRIDLGRLIIVFRISHYYFNYTMDTKKMHAIESHLCVENCLYKGSEVSPHVHCIEGIDYGLRIRFIVHEI